jgi:glycosyltransferase involved in cell wall biosynthesis
MNLISVDLVIYSTPPITFKEVIAKLKRKFNCISYLLLRDIFPQNAVDLGMIKKNSLLYYFFRNKEKALYKASDIIGCLSPANVRYLFENNHDLENKQVHIAPNCVFPLTRIVNANKKIVLDKYNIPFDAVHFVYGGNIGKPQGIDFIMECIEAVKNDSSIFITIIGTGTEYNRLNKFLTDLKIFNAALINYLPKNEYLELLSCMDFGMIFLDNRFTIPNFPSRILDYMNFSLPIVACTDVVCDVKQEICDQGAGFWCQSNDIDGFMEIVEKIKKDKKNICKTMGKKSLEILLDKYSVNMVVKDMLAEINKKL